MKHFFKLTVTFVFILACFLQNPIQAQNQLSSSEKSATDFEVAKNLDIYFTLFKELNTYYVDEIDAADLIKTSIKSMLKTLDPYTVYYPESDAEDYRFMTTGSYGGIGAIIGNVDGKVIVTEPYKGFPADKSGLEAGDIILKIDEKDTKGLNSDEVSDLLRGEPGTKVKLIIQRPFQDSDFEIELSREKIQIDNIPYYGYLDGNIGYIQLTGFKMNAADDVKKAILELQKEKELKGLVFDLRGNPGGLLIEAVKIVGLFIDKGELVVSAKGKYEAWDKEYKTFDNPIAKDLPLTVLINGNSASASEIVSGALQDYDRAVLIGTRSFGKGLVQTTRKLSYNTQLKVTTSKYYIPSGRCIQEIDYSHKDENGKALKFADSLSSEFKTKNGRSVFDGKGISPDIKIGDDEMPDFIVSLLTSRLIFDYATKYKHSHDSIADPEEFSLTESDYQDFVSFCLSKESELKTATEKSLETLKKKAESEGYFESIESEYQQIRSTIIKNKSSLLEKYQDEIKNLLESEIVIRYYYRDGKLQYALKNDKEIDKAISILNNPTEYNSILSGSK